MLVWGVEALTVVDVVVVSEKGAIGRIVFTMYNMMTRN